MSWFVTAAAAAIVAISWSRFLYKLGNIGQSCDWPICELIWIALECFWNTNTILSSNGGKFNFDNNNNDDNFIDDIIAYLAFVAACNNRIGVLYPSRVQNDK